MKRIPRRVVIAIGLLVVTAAACSEDIDPDQALREGLAQQQAGDLDAAAEKYQMVLDLRPEDQYANYNMGVIEQADGRTELAEGYYRSSLDTAPEFVPALFNLAILRTKVGATQEAIDLYERVLVIQADYAAAHLNLGLLLQASGLDKEGAKQLNEAIRLDPSLSDRLTTAPIPPSGGSSPGASASPSAAASASS